MRAFLGWVSVVAMARAARCFFEKPCVLAAHSSLPFWNRWLESAIRVVEWMRE